MEQELRLRMGQANDMPHEIRLALAEKAVLFQTDVQHASSHQKTTRAWEKVTSVDGLLQRHASVYRRCRKAMMQLEADEAMLSRYRALWDEDLKVNMAAAALNARGLRNEKLAWFWGMDGRADTHQSNHTTIGPNAHQAPQKLFDALVATNSEHQRALELIRKNDLVYISLCSIYITGCAHRHPPYT